MPLAFEKAPGEVAVYCDDGDVLFHDAYLWHSAASATDSSAVRRHTVIDNITRLPEQLPKLFMALTR